MLLLWTNPLKIHWGFFEEKTGIWMNKHKLPMNQKKNERFTAHSDLSASVWEFLPELLPQNRSCSADTDPPVRSPQFKNKRREKPIHLFKPENRNQVNITTLSAEFQLLLLLAGREQLNNLFLMFLYVWDLTLPELFQWIQAWLIVCSITAAIQSWWVLCVKYSNYIHLWMSNTFLLK